MRAEIRLKKVKQRLSPVSIPLSPFNWAVALVSHQSYLVKISAVEDVFSIKQSKQATDTQDKIVLQGDNWQSKG